MALDPSDVQTDEDFYEDLVSRSPRLVSGWGGGRCHHSGLHDRILTELITEKVFKYLSLQH